MMTDYRPVFRLARANGKPLFDYRLRRLHTPVTSAHFGQGRKAPGSFPLQFPCNAGVVGCRTGRTAHENQARSASVCRQPTVHLRTVAPPFCGTTFDSVPGCIDETDDPIVGSGGDLSQRRR